MGALAQDTLEPDAFKKLYSDQYYSRFVAEGLRPDGRPLLRARPTTIALGAVTTADSSALVKIGNTTVMAGVKLEVGASSLVRLDRVADGRTVLCRTTTGTHCRKSCFILYIALCQPNLSGKSLLAPWHAAVFGALSPCLNLGQVSFTGGRALQSSSVEHKGRVVKTMSHGFDGGKGLFIEQSV